MRMASAHTAKGKRMTWDEAKVIVSSIKSLYPNWKLEDPRLTIDTWAVVLEDYDYKAIQYAVKRFALTDKSGFPPSVGQLVGQLQEATENGGLSGAEAWALVYRAMKNSAWHSQEEYERLPKNVQRAVGSAETLKSWALSDIDSTTILQSNFLRTYNAVAEQEKKEAVLPKSMRLGVFDGKYIGANDV